MEEFDFLHNIVSDLSSSLPPLPEFAGPSASADVVNVDELMIDFPSASWTEWTEAKGSDDLVNFGPASSTPKIPSRSPEPLMTRFGSSVTTSALRPVQPSTNPFLDDILMPDMNQHFLRNPFLTPSSASSNGRHGACVNPTTSVMVAAASHAGGLSSTVATSDDKAMVSEHTFDCTF